MREIDIDSFAGGGGASVGIERATGKPVDIAINHDSRALAMHRANHPATNHFQRNIWQVHPKDVAWGRGIRLAWFSPDCTHHSKAKGSAPIRTGAERQSRDLAWIVVEWARHAKPRIIMLENVEEFAGWGPLGPDGRPDRERRGETFNHWVQALRQEGYQVEWRELRACDYGSPTIRKRLFLIARRDGLPICWPEPTHGPGLELPYRTAAECIDWQIPCYSIFLTREQVRAMGLRIKRPLAEATMRRIARGLWKYVINSAHPFIVPITHRGDDRVHPIGEPLRTVTTAHRGELGLVAPYFVPRYGERPGQDPRSRTVEEPGSTVVPTGNGDNLVVAHMLQNNTGVVGHPVDDPLHTVVGGGTHGMVAAWLAQHNTGMTGHDAGDPVSTIVERGSTQGLVAAHLAQHRSGSVGQDVRDPNATVVASGITQGLVAAHLTRQFGGSTGQPADAPAPTVVAGGGGKTGLVMAHLGAQYTSNTNGGQGDPEKPLKTVLAGGTHHMLVKAFLMKYYREGGQWAHCGDPTPTVVTKGRLGLVTVAEVDYRIEDVGMRMLVPRELFTAQGFPADYIIDPAYNGKGLTKTDQIRMCGNSVCPQVAEALVAANLRNETHYRPPVQDEEPFVLTAVG